MAITDLTGTTWNVPSGWSATAGYGQFEVNGAVKVTNDFECSGFYVGYRFGMFDVEVASNYIYFNGYGGDTSSSYGFTITITGGTDVTNTSLISWLEANGKLQVDTFQIPVDAPEGVRMLVKGTECKKDIDVIPVLQNKTITENGTYTAESGFAGFGEMIVDVPTPTPTTEKKTVTPSKSVQKVTATGADYLSEVTVNAIPSEYEIPTYFNAETDIEVM